MRIRPQPDYKSPPGCPILLGARPEVCAQRVGEDGGRLTKNRLSRRLKNPQGKVCCVRFGELAPADAGIAGWRAHRRTGHPIVGRQRWWGTLQSPVFLQGLVPVNLRLNRPLRPAPQPFYLSRNAHRRIFGRKLLRRHCP